MAGLVRVNELGLVIPPQRLDCIGEECPVAEKIGRCFVDEHHLYFTIAKFRTDKLSADFESHKFNTIRLPRCQHNSSWSGAIHTMYDGAPKPRAAVMERFLEEAELLHQLGVISVKSDGLITSMDEERDSYDTTMRRLDDWYETQDSFNELSKRAKVECEVTLPVLLRRPDVLHRAVGAVLLDLVGV